MNPQVRTLREVIEEVKARHVIAVVKNAHSMKEAANDLGITVEHLRRLRLRYGLKVRVKTAGEKADCRMSEIPINYDGKSSRANAPGNANPEFQSGYRIGAAYGHLNRSTLDGIIGDEWEHRGRPMDCPLFLEWSRGVLAAWRQGAK